MNKNYVSFKPKKRLIYAEIVMADLLKSMVKRKLLFTLRLAGEWLNCKDICVKLAAIFGKKQGLLVCIR